MNFEQQLNLVTGDLLQYKDGKKYFTSNGDSALTIEILYSGRAVTNTVTVVIEWDYIKNNVTYEVKQYDKTLYNENLAITAIQTQLSDVLNNVNNITGYRSTPKIPFNLASIVTSLSNYFINSTLDFEFTLYNQALYIYDAIDSKDIQDSYCFCGGRGSINGLDESNENTFALDFVIDKSNKTFIYLEKDTTGTLGNRVGKVIPTPPKYILDMLQILYKSDKNIGVYEKAGLSMINICDISSLLLNTLGSKDFSSKVFIRNHNGLSIQAESKSYTDVRLKTAFEYQNGKVVHYVNTLKDEIKRKTVDSLKSAVQGAKTLRKELAKNSDINHKCIDTLEDVKLLPIEYILVKLDETLINYSNFVVNTEIVSINNAVTHKWGNLATDKDAVLRTTIKVDSKEIIIYSVNQHDRVNTVYVTTILVNSYIKTDNKQVVDTCVLNKEDLANLIKNLLS